VPSPNNEEAKGGSVMATAADFWVVMLLFHSAGADSITSEVTKPVV
jgi:hypothetical protein